MEQIENYAVIIAQIIGFITIGATIVVRITPSKKDDADAAVITDKVWRYINMLPTIGINPRTKKLEEAYKDTKANASNP